MFNTFGGEAAASTRVGHAEVRKIQALSRDGRLARAKGAEAAGRDVIPYGNRRAGLCHSEPNYPGGPARNWVPDVRGYTPALGLPAAA